MLFLQACTRTPIEAPKADDTGIVRDTADSGDDTGPVPDDTAVPPTPCDAGYPFGAGGVAYATLQAAIDGGGAVIEVCPGSWPTVAVVPAGRAVTLGPMPDGDADTTILDGAGSGPILSVEAGATLDLRDLELRGGVAEDGGAVYVADATLWTTGVRFVDNVAAGDGGAVRFIAVSPGPEVVMEDTLFDGNAAGASGGGAALSFSDAEVYTLSIGDTSFVDNRAPLGGGLFVLGGEMDVDLRTVAFVDNEADNMGGAMIQTSGARVSMTDPVVANNFATGGYGGVLVDDDEAIVRVERGAFNDNVAQGGVAALNLYGSSGTMEIRDSTFIGNLGVGNGALVVSGSALSIDGSSFIDNYTTGSGGALTFASSFFSAGVLEIRDSSFAACHAEDDCGAVYVSGIPSVTLTNVTIDDNAAGRYGGGACLAGTVTLDRGMITRNDAGESGGGLFLDTDTTLTATAVDFGDGADDNTPDDIHGCGALGAYATFTYDPVSGRFCD